MGCMTEVYTSLQGEHAHTQAKVWKTPNSNRAVNSTIQILPTKSTYSLCSPVQRYTLRPVRFVRPWSTVHQSIPTRWQASSRRSAESRRPVAHQISERNKPTTIDILAPKNKQLPTQPQPLSSIAGQAVVNEYSRLHNLNMFDGVELRSMTRQSG